uniref:Uncharacterized protein n=1 Tax=Oryzias latipes TaxID=8090 RepID=A0A3P9IRZ7_ORYLA
RGEGSITRGEGSCSQWEGSIARGEESITRGEGSITRGEGSCSQWEGRCFAPQKLWSSNRLTAPQTPRAKGTAPPRPLPAGSSPLPSLTPLTRGVRRRSASCPVTSGPCAVRARVPVD